jgi:hypothetical protein
MAGSLVVVMAGVGDALTILGCGLLCAKMGDHSQSPFTTTSPTAKISYGAMALPKGGQTFPQNGVLSVLH